MAESKRIWSLGSSTIYRSTYFSRFSFELYPVFISGCKKDFIDLFKSGISRAERAASLALYPPIVFRPDGNDWTRAISFRFTLQKLSALVQWKDARENLKGIKFRWRSSLLSRIYFTLLSPPPSCGIAVWRKIKQFGNESESKNRHLPSSHVFYSRLVKNQFHARTSSCAAAAASKNH